MKARNRNIVILAGVGLALWYFTSQSQRIDVGSASISRLKLEGGGIRINIQLPIINRSDFPVPVSGFLGRLLYNGAEIGTVQQTVAAQLTPRAVTNLEFTTVVSFIGALSSTPLLSILNSLAQKYLGISLPGIPATTPVDGAALNNALKAMRIQGTLYVGSLGIDINEPLTT